MPSSTQILEYLREHQLAFAQEYGIRPVAIFGSISRGDACDNSDIDLLIEVEKDVVSLYEKKTALKLVLETHFGTSVDLAREKYLKPFAREAILKEAQFV